jgi:hypothetical protein
VVSLVERTRTRKEDLDLPKGRLKLSVYLPIGSKNGDYDFGVEHELSDNLTIAADYSYIHGLHLLRPRNINQGNFDLITSYARAMSVCPRLPVVSANGCANPIYQGAGGDLAGL